MAFLDAGNSFSPQSALSDASGVSRITIARAESKKDELPEIGNQPQAR